MYRISFGPPAITESTMKAITSSVPKLMPIHMKIFFTSRTLAQKILP